MKFQRLRPYEFLYNALCNSAKHNHREVEITYEDFLLFVQEPSCHYCEVPVLWAEYHYADKGRRIATKYNIDRKNNELGYTWDNCVVCCTRCNKAKSNLFTYQEWLIMTAALKRSQAASV